MSTLQKGITFSYCNKFSVDKNAELAKCHLTIAMTNWQAAEIRGIYSEELPIINAMTRNPIKYFSVLSQDPAVDSLTNRFTHKKLPMYIAVNF